MPTKFSDARAPRVRHEPPVVFARSNLDEQTRLLTYEYNGRTLVRLRIPGNGDVRYRVKSDACIQSSPHVSQIYVIVDSDPLPMRVDFCLSEDAAVMRPHRARAGQAVLGQVGRATIAGVNGLYDLFDDLLLSWNGAPWRWLDPELRADGSGLLTVSIEVEAGRMPWIVNLLPQYYRRHLGYTDHKPWEKRPNLKPVAGWCSWEAYSRDVTEQKIAGASAFLSRHFKDYGFEYIQVDDGYQQTPIVIRKERSLADAWATPSERFPSGLSALCRSIAGHGLKPGIWISASIWPPAATGVEEDKDCLLKDEHGNLLDSRWIHRAVDCRPGTLDKHIRPLFRMLRDAGFQYIKTDQIRHLLYDALQELVHRGLLGNDESRARFRAYMEATREAMGDDVYYLASWGVLSEVIGVCDACRIACDANPKWQRVRMQIAEAARWFHAQRILFLNDPDHICARTRPEWAQALLSHVSLTGGLFMLSDPIASYDEQRIRMIQQVLPPLPTRTAETGPLDMHYPAFAWTKEHGAAYQGGVEMAWDDVNDQKALEIAGVQDTMNDAHPFSSLWAFHLKTGAGTWCVAGRFATMPLRASSIPLTALGLEPERPYAAFDFWAERYLGTVNQSLRVPALAVGCCQIIAFRERLDHPQFLASTRHVSMDAVSVRAQRWEDGVLELDLAGVAGATETYWFHCPKGWALAAIEAEGGQADRAATDREAVAVRVAFTRGAVSLRAKWKCGAIESDRGLR